MANKHILFLTELAPFPTYGGEQLRSFGLLKILSESNYRVTSIISNPQKVDLLNVPINNIKFFEYDFKKNRNYLIRAFEYFTKNHTLINFIETVIADDEIDIVFFDYGFWGQYINYFKQKGIKVIYGVHNLQSELEAKVNPSKIRGYIILKLASLHEKLYFKNVDALITVSKNDKRLYSDFVDDKKIHVIPNFVDERNYHPASSKNNYIVFTGNFLAVQNQNGLKWFLNNIWSQELYKQTKLVIAGNNSAEFFSTLQHNKEDLNIEVLGAVEHMQPIIAKARIAVVPILEGSGTRLKCVEAMALKTQLVSTSIGVEGIEHNDSILIADTPKLFKNLLLEVLINEMDYTEVAHSAFIVNYALEVNLNRIKTIIKSIDY